MLDNANCFISNWSEFTKHRFTETRAQILFPSRDDDDDDDKDNDDKDDDDDDDDDVF